MDPVATVADGSERKLDPNSVHVARIAAGITTAILSFVLLVATVLFSIFGPFAGFAVLIPAAVWATVTSLLVAFGLWWPLVRYRHTAYEVSELGIRIRRGVVWRAVHAIPRSRVQHTDVAQGPIERIYGLATLVIYTAGTHHASTSLGGLRREQALLIRDHLIVGGEGDAV